MSDMLVIGVDPSLGGTGLCDGPTTHVIRTKPGTFLDERIDGIVDELDAYVFRDRAPRRICFAVEAPLTASSGVAGGGHLYEIGHLMRALRAEYVGDLRAAGVEVIWLEVQIGTLRHHTIGAGNAPKDFLAYAVERIHGLTFADDRGADRLVAWSAHRYGTAVLAGEIEHVFAAQRGSGARSRTAIRRTAKTRARTMAGVA
jgi:hypothetical protein